MRYVIVVVALLMAGCEGRTGPIGPVGPQGADGNPGAQGPAGPQGADGAGLDSITRCKGQIVIGTTTYLLEHIGYDFRDGGALATCDLWGPGSDFNSVDMWASGTNGAVLASCLLKADLDTASYGFLVFDMAADRRSSKATYLDQGSTNHQRVLPLTCAVD